MTYIVPIEELRNLAEQGKSDQEIGRIFKCPSKLIHSRRKANGIPAGRPAAAPVNMDIDRLAELAGRGLTDRQIALELGCSARLVRARRAEYGIHAGRSKFRGKHAVPAETPPDKRNKQPLTKADAAFSRLMAGRRFSEVKVSAAKPLTVKRQNGSGDISLTGCAASMCVR